MANVEAIKKLAERYDSFYLYDESVIKQSIRDLKESFSDILFLYSVKCNPNANVLRSVFSEGLGADAASLGEVIKAKEAGLPKEDIYYSAPGKTDKEIEGAIEGSVLIADSLGELERIDAIAEKKGLAVSVGVRINPSFSFYGEVGTATPSKFGVDEDQLLSYLKENDLKNVHIDGIHVHLKSQELSKDVIVNYYKKITALAERIEAALGEKLRYVNMGSGIGINYSPSDKPIDIKQLGAETKEALKAYRESHPDTRVIIESGRYIVGKSGTYVTKVIDKKISRGTTFVVLKNTLNGFIRPSLINLALLGCKDGAPAAWEPMYTCADAFTYTALKGGAKEEKVTLVGNLCTAIDMVAQDIPMPHLEIGDIIMIDNAGAYAAVLTPMQFASLEPPAELFLSIGGTAY